METTGDGAVRDLLPMGSHARCLGSSVCLRPQLALPYGLSRVPWLGSQQMDDGLDETKCRWADAVETGLDLQVVVGVASGVVQFAVDAPEGAVTRSEHAVSVKSVDFVEPVHGVAVVADHVCVSSNCIESNCSDLVK